jgi:SAM-dependent methyltransferase
LALKLLCVNGVGFLEQSRSSFDLVLMLVSVCFFEKPLRAFKEAHRVLKNDGYLVLGLVLSDSPWADFYKEKARRGHPI